MQVTTSESSEVDPNAGRQEASRLPPNDQLAGVQILRGFAALAVVFHHTLEETSAVIAPDMFPYALARLGSCGVDVFFVISGFIMLHTNWHRVGQPDAAGDFLWRRALRIYPFYWVCLATLLVAHACGLFKALVIRADSLIASVLLYPTLYPPSSRQLIHIAWTLVFEVYFYLVFACWIRTRSVRKLLLGVPLTLLAVNLAARLLPESGTRSFFANGIVFEFLFGLGVAWLYRRHHRPSSPVLGSAVACVAFVVASFWNPVSSYQLTDGLNEKVRFLAWGLPATLITWAWLAPLKAQRTPWRWLGALGNTSYALYLTHIFVMTSLARCLTTPRLAQALPPWAWVATAVSVSLALGWTAHHWVEEPLNGRLRLLYAKARAGRAAAAPAASRAETA